MANKDDLVTIKSVGVDDWEYKNDSLCDTTRHVIYKVYINDSQNNNKIVFRRYSDFVYLDSQIKRMLTDFTFSLPPKEYVGQIAGMFGIKKFMSNFYDEEKLINRRRISLDLYLKSVLSFVGYSKSSFWNHPIILTFFDIPFIKMHISQADLQSNAKFSYTDREWFEAINSMVEHLKLIANLSDKIDQLEKEGKPVKSHLTQYNREYRQINKKMEKLNSSLDVYSLSKDDNIFQERKNQFIGDVLDPFSELKTLQIPKRDCQKSDSKILEDLETQIPIARTPSKSTTSSRNDSLKKKKSPLETIHDQDEKLQEISSILKQHQYIGNAINEELGTISMKFTVNLDNQNKLVKDIKLDLGNTGEKMKNIEEKVKKL